MDPTIAGANRQPNSLYPKSFIPIAISHLPIGG